MLSSLLNLFILIVEINGNLIFPDISKDLINSYCSLNISRTHNHTPFSYLIKESHLCDGDVFLLTYVQSSSLNFHQRMMIRQTWGSLKFINIHPVRLLFIVGKAENKRVQIKIKQESINYRDIVQADFIDSYRNLTIKHIVALHWMDKYCPNAQFISKTDDDTLINIFSLVPYLKEHFNSSEKAILGNIAFDEIPIRKGGFKWTITNEMYPYDKYPPFLKGFAYIIFQAAIKPLLICSYYHKYLFIDDIFITGLVAPSANVNLKNFDDNFGRVWITNESMPFGILDNLFFVSQEKYLPHQWLIVWNRILKLEL